MMLRTLAELVTPADRRNQSATPLAGTASAARRHQLGDPNSRMARLIPFLKPRGKFAS